jgi:hypothetical protein
MGRKLTLGNDWRRELGETSSTEFIHAMTKKHFAVKTALQAEVCVFGTEVRQAVRPLAQSTLVDESDASGFLIELLNQAMALIPWIEASVSSFAAGPLGIFSPRSHLLTTPTVTFKCAAKTAWLTSALARMRRMAAGLSFLTGVRQLRSKLRIVFLSIKPRR